jgi:pyruvate/2-oxoglutarate dehydrogenase complex dihydrolipoamide dehydrogenase (E3) component
MAPNAGDVINVFTLAIKKDLCAHELQEMMLSFPTSTSDIPSML